MFLRRSILIIMLVFCVNALSGCKGDKGGSIVRQRNNLMKEICDALNSIENDKSAEEAIPKLKELTVEFTQVDNELLKYKKENPGFEQKYSQELQRYVLDWGKALSNFNTNQKISKELRRD